jgi:hypothetical protein
MDMHNSDLDKKDLTPFDDLYRAARVSRPADNTTVPDGKYAAVIRSATLRHSHSGDPMLTLRFSVSDPLYADCELSRNTVFTPNTLAFVKADLEMCGLKLEALSDLPAQLQKLVGVTVELTKRTKGDHHNIYLNRRLNGGRAEHLQREGANVRGVF